MRAITLSAGLKKGYSLGEAISFLEQVSNEKLKGISKLILKDKAENIKNLLSNLSFCFVYRFYLYI